MYRLQSGIFRFFQVLGTVMAVVGIGTAIMWGMQGQKGDALFAGLVALASVGFVALAGWMRRAAKKPQSFFRPRSANHPQAIVRSRPIADVQVESHGLGMRTLTTVSLAVLLSSCLPNEKPPPIADGMELSIANEEWPPRLAKRFPPGTTEAELTTTLSAQGFVIDLTKKTAKADWSTGVCNNEVDVVWQTNATGTLVSIGGRYFPVCP